MDLGQALSVARRRWLVLVAFVVVGLGAGLAHTELSTPRYQASTSVFFSLSRGQTVGELAQGSTYLQGLVQSYADVTTSGIVLGPVIQDLDLQVTPAQLAGGVTATPRRNTSILDIRVTDDSPQGAARLADALANQLSDAVATLSPSSSARAPAVTISTISPAAIPTRPSAPRLPVDLGIGFAAGLLLGIAVIVLADVVVSPVGTRRAAAAAAGAPVLASIARDRKRGRPLPVVSDPHLPRAESFWMLRTTVESQSPADGPLCLVVASALPGEGRTGTAVNLAIAMAHTAHQVLLVDADLRRPAVAGLLGLDEAEGLSTVLTGVSSLEEAIRTWTSPEPAGGFPRLGRDLRVDPDQGLASGHGETSLAVLPAGPPPTSPSELLASEVMDKVLDTVRNRYDIILIDTPALLRVADGAVLAAHADGALLVVDSRRSRQKRLVEAVDRLQLAGAPILGVVLNRTRAERAGGYRRRRGPLHGRPRRAAGRFRPTRAD